MQSVFLATVAAVLVAGCLGQGMIMPSFMCMSLNNFTAPTFDTLRFRNSTSYHDSTNFRTVFEESDDQWLLYDFPAGAIYYANGDACSVYQNDNLILTVDDMMSMAVTANIDQWNGSPAFSYELPKGDNFLVKGIILEDCVETLTYLQLDGRPITIAVYDSFEIGNNDVIADKVGAAQDFVASHECTQLISVFDIIPLYPTY